MTSRTLLLVTLFLMPALSSAQVAQASACCPVQSSHEKQQVLWQKMTDSVQAIDHNLNGVLGVAILDLTDGRQFLLHGDEVFPQASSIKIAVLAELYHQEQESQQGMAGKQRLGDLYTVRKEDMVPDSDIMLGLTPGVTQVTNRDLATMMVAVSDNSATNVLIDRLGMENVNALLRSLGLYNTMLRRKMMDVKAAREGRENVATPREMMTLLAAIYQGKLFNQPLTQDFIKMLSTAWSQNSKGSNMLKGLPPGVMAAEKPGELEAVRADSGIVFATNRPFVLCVMTTYLSDERDGAKAIQEVAAAVFPYFDMVGRASEYGRVVSPRDSR
jgi:beta-lactamase class A